MALLAPLNGLHVAADLKGVQSRTPATDARVFSKSLPTLGEAVPSVAERFAPSAALGVLIVDTSRLEQLETRHGTAVFDKVRRSLEEAIRGLLEDVLDPRDIVARGEVGRGEVAVLLLRDEQRGGLCRDELPALCAHLSRGLERAGQSVIYPYARQLPSTPIGFALALRNPRLGALTQVRDALDQARDDAQLNHRLELRHRRRDFMTFLLEGSVISVYEPVVCTRSLTVYGYEALARGPQDSEFAAAGALFGAATEHGMLYELDCLCRAAALEGAIDFPAGTKLFMNIRPTSIHDPRFRPDALIRTLEKCRLSPSDVVLEISEQESIDNYDVFRETRDQYGQLGFQFALDDTGAGYASLEAVMRLAPEFIKVDRAFVTGIDEDAARQAMVRGFQQVARSVGARIIGEGLDRLEELQKLAELGIEFGQGWLFGKATPLRAQSR